MGAAKVPNASQMRCTSKWVRPECQTYPKGVLIKSRLVAEKTDRYDRDFLSHNKKKSGNIRCGNEGTNLDVKIIGGAT